jgi:hypothetical protein
MIVSTALMIAGAAAGGAGGFVSNEQRKADARKALQKQRIRDRQNEVAKLAYSEILKGNLTVGALQASGANEADAAKVAENIGTMEQNAGNSGLKGGTPFFQLGSYAAKALRKADELGAARVLELKGQELQGKNTIDQYRQAGTEIGYDTEAAAKAYGYFNSPVAAFMSVATGALAGASFANKVSTTLTGMGVDMGAELFPGKASGAFDATKLSFNAEDIPAVPDAPAVPELGRAPTDLRSAVFSLNSGIPSMQEPLTLKGVVPFSQDPVSDPSSLRWPGQSMDQGQSLYPYLTPPRVNDWRNGYVTSPGSSLGGMFGGFSDMGLKGPQSLKLESLFNAPDILMSAY